MNMRLTPIDPVASQLLGELSRQAAALREELAEGSTPWRELRENYEHLHRLARTLTVEGLSPLPPMTAELLKDGVPAGVLLGPIESETVMQ